MDELRIGGGDVGDDLDGKHAVFFLTIFYGFVKEFAVVDPFLVDAQPVLMPVVEAGLIGRAAVAVGKEAVGFQ